METVDLKERIREHWEHEVCGARWATDHASDRKLFFDEIERTRYIEEYMLREFADFKSAKGKKVLEVGLGTGTDFVQWARNGALAFGRDVTSASVDLVKERLRLEGLEADVARGDAEALEFPDQTFDIFYSWGVLMHAPNTEQTIAEAYRVLKPGGTFKIMLYKYPSVGATLIWLLYGLLRFDFRKPQQVIAENVESPNTKFFTIQEARAMVGRFFGAGKIVIRTYLGSGDLLTHVFSPKYQGWKWRLIKKLYPRWFVRHFLGHRFGTVMTIHATKAD